MVEPKGPPAARCGSTWIHWWSPVASANRSIRFWSTSSHPLGPSVSPIPACSSSADVKILGSAMPLPLPGRISACSACWGRMYLSTTRLSTNVGPADYPRRRAADSRENPRAHRRPAVRPQRRGRLRAALLRDQGPDQQPSHRRQPAPLRPRRTAPGGLRTRRPARRHPARRHPRGTRPAPRGAHPQP